MSAKVLNTPRRKPAGLVVSMPIIWASVGIVVLFVAVLFGSLFSIWLGLAASAAIFIIVATLIYVTAARNGIDEEQDGRPERPIGRAWPDWRPIAAFMAAFFGTGLLSALLSSTFRSVWPLLGGGIVMAVLVAVYVWTV